jgi:hypothetical protein
MTKKAEALLLKQARGTKRTCQNTDCGMHLSRVRITVCACFDAGSGRRCGAQGKETGLSN